MGKDLAPAAAQGNKSYPAVVLAAKYLHYFLTAANGKGHGAHSPFVFHFITRLLNDRKQYPEYSLVESIRKKMYADNRVVKVNDLGAGSAIAGGKERKLSAIARRAAKPMKYGQLLFRMVSTWQPGTILELGTSLGITTAYLSLANPHANVISIEGAPEVAAIARENLRLSGAVNARVEEGDFDDQLPRYLATSASIDFAFIDGNHLREPTIRYFEQLLPAIHNESVIVFDDIHWSSGMEAAWETIKSHKAVRCSIDLFFIGVIFFRKEFMEKQHFTIRF